MSQRTVITGGTIVTGAEQVRADLVIDDQQIVALLDDAAGVDADEQIDATDLYVMPGFVDIDAAVPDPAATSRAVADARAAAAGGTTVMVTNLDTAGASEGARTGQTADIAYWYPIGEGPLPSAEQVSRMAQTGIAGFAASMRSNDQRGWALPDADLLALLELIAKLDMPLSLLAVHPELKLSNPIAEIAAVGTALLFAEHSGAWLHLRGLTTAEALHRVADARVRGVRVTASVPALHLGLTASEATRLLRPMPPLRSQETIDDLWPFVLDETVDCISSTRIRRKGRDGSPVCDTQTVPSLFWDEAVLQRGMSPSQAVRMLSGNPAHIAGLHPRKGAIRIGNDADLVLFDPKGTWTARSREMLGEDAWTALDGRELTGFVVRTIRRGETIYDADRHDDQELLPEGSGVLLARA